ncbi:MAG: ABC transporter permease, partial [Phycisphaerales bacterium]|nr:ABC transporter permease [Phycisphaerales bacterium]
VSWLRMDQSDPTSPTSAPTQRVRRRLSPTPAGLGLLVLVLITVACLGSLPWTLAGVSEGDAIVPRYNSGDPRDARIAPFWLPGDDPRDPHSLLGTDHLGRSLLVRSLAGGGISLGIGLAAALISVTIGTVYGAVAGYSGGVLDGVMMRVVDVLYGLPYILLVVLLAVASDAVIDEHVTRARARADWIMGRTALLADSPEAADRRLLGVWLAEHPEIKAEIETEALAAVPPRQVSQSVRSALDITTLLVAIGGVSWLTLARVIRGQVLSLKNQPFVEAARAAGAHPARVFLRHLLPNLVGPIVVYVTLTIPQAVLQESFLSFLGIGVKPPMPSWGNLAAEGLGEINPYKSHWWLLAVPSVLLGVTLISLNFVGEGLREAIDPRHDTGRGRHDA